MADENVVNTPLPEPTHPLQDVTVATVRTGVNSFWLVLIVYLVQRIFDFTIDVTDPLIVLGSPVAVIAWYRISVLLQRVDVLAWLLFGIARSPQYRPTVRTPSNEGE